MNYWKNFGEDEIETYKISEPKEVYELVDNLLKKKDGIISLPFEYIEDDTDLSKYQYIPTNKQEKAYKLIEFLTGKPIPRGLKDFFIIHIPDPNDPHHFDYKVILQDGKFVLKDFNLFTELCESNVPILTSDKLDLENKEYIIFIEDNIQAHS